MLRLVNLGHPHQLAFDETYYVKDAWSLWTLGYEGTWGEDANEAFITLRELPLSDEGSFIVHPPLGKWLIALGMAIGGPDDSVGWRLATALLGTASVLLVFLIARRLTGSIVVRDRGRHAPRRRRPEHRDEPDRTARRHRSPSSCCWACSASCSTDDAPSRCSNAAIPTLPTSDLGPGALAPTVADRRRHRPRRAPAP